MTRLIAAALALAGSAQGGPEIPELSVEVAFPGIRFERPVVIAHPPDGTDRIFVVEQPGRVRWFENRPDVKETTLALDISAKVLSRGNEEGLLGIAFHPKFKANRTVFLQYSWPHFGLKLKEQRRNILSRFTMNKDHTKILPESERPILEVPQPFENHNGGNLQFGPDGYLYIGLGDGGAANDPHGNGQKMSTFLGKFLRIDVDRQAGGKPYAVPPDNPFVGKPGVLPEIWSAGWRNPWGYHFDRKTGELWSGDVGQDKWEEINIVKKGANYGWNVREAAHPFKEDPAHKGPFEEPVAEHDHGVAKSITGGVVYRGKKNPALDGLYLYGDFVTGNLWALRWDGTKVADSRHLLEFKSKQISCFGEDRDGEVYFATFTDGRLYRFVPKK
jgi:glucose/arabinose dehydrogenase